MSFNSQNFMAGYLAGVELRRHRAIPVEPSPPSGNFLTFSSHSPFTIATYNATKNWNGTLEWSTDAEAWNVWNGETVLTASQKRGFYILLLRGTENSYITRVSEAARWIINGTGVSCKGYIDSLLDCSALSGNTRPEIGQYAFRYMFRGCLALVEGPSFPDSDLPTNCYQYMFDGCSNLQFAPDLPSTEIGYNCYYGMFRDCTSLRIAPNLPATTLKPGCYSYMFSGCTALVYAPTISAASVSPANASSSCRYMFEGCTSLETIPKLLLLSVPQYCYGNMFYGCSKIKLSATQTDEYNAPYRIPTSGTGTANSTALTQMFANTGGTFTGTPNINTIYYTANEVV